MAPLQVRVKAEEMEMVGRDEPVSPTGQYLNSSVLSVAILVVFEYDTPIDHSLTMWALENLFLPINLRFSSIMVRDEQGVLQWRRVEVNLEEHVHVPNFPSGLDAYDEYLQDYISNLSNQLPQSRPLWDVHLIKFPTSKAAGTMVFRIHHSLGDGYSLMAALFNTFQMADDPSLPLTFPSGSKPKPTKNGMMGMISKVPSALSMCVNTVRDFGLGVLKSNLVEDDVSPVRLGTPGVEFLPITLSSIDFSLDDIKKIKTKIRGTINDVICGIVFLGIRMYIEAASEEATAKPESVTALVLLNTRDVDICSYQPLDEMSKPDTKSPWGNHFAFIDVGIPSCKDPKEADPLQFVQKVRKILKRKKNSLAAVLTGKLLEMIRRLRGSEVCAKYLHTTLRNASMAITNLAGPLEKMNFAGHPVRSFYFTVIGGPQSVTMGVVSYMGKLKLAMGIEKGFIDPKLLSSCMERSFERISQAAIGMKP